MFNQEQPMWNPIDEDSRAAFRRLLLAKQLYAHGVDHSYKPNPLDKMIAVHNLHNAIEIALRAIFLHYDIRAERELNIDFETMLNEIDKAHPFKERGIKLPYRQELRNLNLLRGQVQHHAVEPEASTMEEYRVFTRRFLERAFKTYFDLDWNSLSPIDMIICEQLKELLKLAFEDIQTAEVSRGLARTEAAFYFASRNIYVFVPDKYPPQLYGEHFGSKNDTKEVNAVFAQTSRTSIYYSALLWSGVSLVDYKRFTENTPTFTQIGSAEGNRIQFHWGQKQIPDTETALWIHNFVVSTIVHWQVVGIGPTVQDSWSEAARMLSSWDENVRIF